METQIFAILKKGVLFLVCFTDNNTPLTSRIENV